MSQLHPPAPPPRALAIALVVYLLFLLGLGLAAAAAFTARHADDGLAPWLRPLPAERWSPDAGGWL